MKAPTLCNGAIKKSLKLNADNLIERRLRTAIWQKTDLLAWLNALSDEAKQNKNGVIGWLKQPLKHPIKKLNNT